MSKKTRKSESHQQGDLTAPIGQPTASLMSMDFDSQPPQPTLAGDQNQRCTKCGNICQNGQCVSCKYIEPVFANLYLPLDQIPIQLVGFQRWFCKTMTEGISINVLKVMFHSFAGLATITLAVLAIVHFSGRVSVPFLGVILSVVLAALILFYVGSVVKGQQFLRSPNARLAWFQKPFWRLILSISRKLDWQRYDDRCKGRTIITLHDEMFGDFEFSQLENLPGCQVLDLQGTRVSDKTIERLYTLKNLHCVVLTKTAVSHEAVFRFHQSFPTIWIWH